MHRNFVCRRVDSLPVVFSSIYFRAIEKKNISFKKSFNFPNVNKIAKIGVIQVNFRERAHASFDLE